jgi:hypothetical protein
VARGRFALTVVLLLVLALAGLLVARGHGGSAPREIGLFASLPIVWRESADLSGLLRSDAPPHWARQALETRGRLRPLDTLAGKDGTLPLAPDALLVLAQPRPLAPRENVALDAWVRAGGRLLLFADPMLTAPSAFALGDKRRPQDIALLSPILSRWGLVLQFDEDQPAGEHEVALYGAAMPVDLPGRFAIDGTSRCALAAEGLAAQCRIGRGAVLALADAALLDESPADGSDTRREMLGKLLERLDGSD